MSEAITERQQCSYERIYEADTFDEPQVKSGKETSIEPYAFLKVIFNDVTQVKSLEQVNVLLLVPTNNVG